MKIWLEYLLAILLGLGLALFLPESGIETFRSLLPALEDLVLRLGTYLVFPLIFFTMAYGIYKLRNEKRFLRVSLKTLALIILSSLLLTLLGTASVIIFQPQRIPVIIESEKVFVLPGIFELLTEAFPYNLFSIFSKPEAQLFPLVLLAIILGFGFSFDKVLARPSVQFFDSFSRIFYRVSRFFIHLLSLGMVVLAAAYTISAVGTPEITLFTQLFLLLAVNCIILLFGLYPLVIYLLTRDGNPYRILYALIAPGLTAFFSGDSYFTYPHLALHVKENLGVPRPVGGTTLPIFTLLGKAGTAMVSSAGFIVLISSYSSLGITMGELVWIFFTSFGLSFFAGAIPKTGLITAIAVLCAGYGRGIDHAYLILLPALPFLMSFASLLDTVTAGVGSYLVAHGETGVDVHKIKNFV